MKLLLAPLNCCELPVDVVPPPPPVAEQSIKALRMKFTAGIKTVADCPAGMLMPKLLAYEPAPIISNDPACPVLLTIVIANVVLAGMTTVAAAVPH